MKQKDLAPSVMKKVAGFETSRTLWWIIRLIVILGALGALVVYFFSQATSDLIANKTFELFLLFEQDWEIISEYWQDTLLVIWEESPQERILLGVVALTAIIAVVWFVHDRVAVIQKRLQSLKKLKAQKEEV